MCIKQRRDLFQVSRGEEECFLQDRKAGKGIVRLRRLPPLIMLSVCVRLFQSSSGSSEIVRLCKPLRSGMFAEQTYSPFGFGAVVSECARAQRYCVSLPFLASICGWRER